MVRSNVPTIALAVCLAVVSDPGSAAAQGLADDSKALQGLWSGFWGGGERNGVVFQPVRAELVVEGDRVALAGFRTAGRLSGTVRFAAGARRMHITPTPAAKALEYAYVLKGDELTLTDADKHSISLKRHPVARNPLANARLELVAATGINDAGDLLVTEYTALRTGPAGVTYFQPVTRSLKTKQATVLLVQDTGVRTITIAEARGLIRPATPVVVTYRPDDRPAPHQLHELWQDMGSPPPDSAAVGQTLARTLRPGTLVFILSEKENAPVP